VINLSKGKGTETWVWADRNETGSEVHNKAAFRYYLNEVT